MWASRLRDFFHVAREGPEFFRRMRGADVAVVRAQASSKRTTAQAVLVLNVQLRKRLEGEHAQSELRTNRKDSAHGSGK